MGGKPSKGTKKDKRLKTNSPKTTKKKEVVNPGRVRKRGRNR
jgi:hypothetical protein